MKKLTTNLLPIYIICTSFFVTGCANISTTKHQPNKEIQVIELVPTGELNIEALSQSWGGIFGVVGVLLEAGINSSDNKSRSEDANSKSTQDAAFTVMENAIKASLPPKYGKNYIVQKRASPNTAFTEWYNGDQADLAGKNSNSEDRLIIEYGFQSLVINKTLGGSQFAGGTIGIRFVDPKTGKVIGRARTYGEFEKIIVDPNINQGKPTRDGVNDAFKKSITRLTEEAILKITQ